MKDDGKIRGQFEYGSSLSELKTTKRFNCFTCLQKYWQDFDNVLRLREKKSFLYVPSFTLIIVLCFFTAVALKAADCFQTQLVCFVFFLSYLFELRSCHPLPGLSVTSGSGFFLLPLSSVSALST